MHHLFPWFLWAARAGPARERMTNCTRFQAENGTIFSPLPRSENTLKTSRASSIVMMSSLFLPENNLLISLSLSTNCSCFDDAHLCRYTSMIVQFWPDKQQITRPCHLLFHGILTPVQAPFCLFCRGTDSSIQKWQIKCNFYWGTIGKPSLKSHYLIQYCPESIFEASIKMI